MGTAAAAATLEQLGVPRASGEARPGAAADATEIPALGGTSTAALRRQKIMLKTGQWDKRLQTGERMSSLWPGPALADRTAVKEVDMPTSQHTTEQTRKLTLTVQARLGMQHTKFENVK